MNSSAIFENIEINLEFETQDRVKPEFLPGMQELLLIAGGQLTSFEEAQFTSYHDTDDCDFFPLGIEARAREKKNKWRVEMKLDKDKRPIVTPDQDGILRRYELKARKLFKPTFSVFQHHPELSFIGPDLKDIFKEEAECKFLGIFDKTKIERDFQTAHGTGTIEYLLKEGYFESPDGKSRFPRKGTMGIIETECKIIGSANTDTIMRSAHAELKAVYGQKLTPMFERGIVMGYRMIEPTLKGKARENVQHTLAEYEKLAVPLLAVA